MKTLDVGCGNNKAKGAIGIDFNADTQADVVHDLNSYPYPFEDNEFEKILCNHIIEHIDDVVSFVEKLYRSG
jgi:predicted SAM-dependent methyltransferase